MTVRARLAAGYAILFILALVALELALYSVLESTLHGEVDKALRDRARQIERAAIVRGEESLTSQRFFADIFALSPSSPSEELTAPGIHVHMLTIEGDTIAISSNVAAQIPVDDGRLQRARNGQRNQTTIELDDRSVRVMYVPIRLGGNVAAVAVLGESLYPMEVTLARVERLLMIFGVIALFGGLLSGWLLTRQALRPVEDLSQRVARIAETGEFTERVPEPSEPNTDEIGRLAVTFNDLLDRLDLMVDRQRALVADTSHELRNPLMVVRGNLELLAHDLPAEDRREAASDAIEEVDRMTVLIQDLLFLADADANAAIEHHEVALEGIVAAVADDARKVATREDGARAVVLAANDPIIVLGDAERLRQLIWNLVENAIRYTPAGGTVTLALHRRGPVAELTVSDTGIGIPAEHLTHIFERFYRVDTGRSRAVGGTGLGLSIVRQIAESHGGQVRVRSTPGEGSTFTVALPIAG
jgi:signal transduction histidine kinase